LARSVIVNNVEPNAVMGGNPARHLRDRALNSVKKTGD
jgi:acetyltransferase-like isoleucine patch superfamily enzyme